MQRHPVELKNVTYNAARQQFEGLATVHDPAGLRRYPCAIDAPIDMPYARAADGLAIQALRRHDRGTSGSYLSQTISRRRTMHQRLRDRVIYPLRWFPRAA